MMSDVAGDQSCTSFEGDTTEENQMQREATTEAPVRQSEMQDRPSENKHEPPSDGQVSKDDVDEEVLRRLSSINITGSSGQASPTARDVIQVDGLSSPYIAVSPRETPPLQRNSLAELDICNPPCIGGVEVHRHTIPTESKVEVVSSENVPLEEESHLERQSIPSQSGVQFVETVTEDDGNRKASPTKQSSSGNATEEWSFEVKSMKKKVTLYRVKIPAVSDALNEGTVSPDRIKGASANEQVSIDIHKIKDLQNQPSSASTKMKAPISQQVLSALSEKRSQLTQQNPTTNIAESQLPRHTPSTSEARMMSHITQVLSAAAAEMRSQLSQQSQPVSEEIMRSHITQVISAAATQMRSHLSKQAESASVAQAPSASVAQAPSASVSEIRSQLPQSVVATKIKSQHRHQAEAASTTEMRSRLTQQSQSVSENEARMRSYISQVISAATQQLSKEAESVSVALAPSASVSEMRSQLPQSVVAIEMQSQHRHQGETASATEMRSHLTQVESSDSSGMRSYLPQQDESASADKLSQLTQTAAASKMRSQLSQKDEPASACRIRSRIIQYAPSASASEILPHLTQQAELSAESEMRPKLTLQAPSTAADKMRSQFTQRTLSVSDGMKMQLNEQAVARNKTQLSQQTPAAVAGKTALIPQQLPSASRTPITQQTSEAVSGRKVKLTASGLPSWKNVTMVQARRGRTSVSRATPNTEDSPGKKLPPTVRDLPEINVQNIKKGIHGHRFQQLFPARKRPPYRSLTERMYMERITKVVDLTKEKKRKAKKKKRSRKACEDDLSEDSWTTSSSDEQKSPPKSIPSSPELQFDLEL